MASWNASAHPERVRELVRALEGRLPSAQAPGLTVGLQETEAHLEMKVELAGYPRAAVAELAAEVERSGGTLVEVWRLPKAERDVVRERCMTGGRPVSDYATAAQLLAEHLSLLAAVSARASTPPRSQAAGEPPGGAGGALPQGASGPQPPVFAIPRRGRRFAVRLETEFRTDLDFVREHATNISNGGLFVRTALRPPLDSVVRVLVRMPNGEALEGEAVVVHVVDDPYKGGVGVAFLSEDTTFAQTLDRYLASLVGRAP